MARCPACNCTVDDGDRAHAVVAALGADNIDQALELGLLDAGLACDGCSEVCRAALAASRLQRVRALAARERFRARNERLERRQRERATQRKPVAPGPGAPALPPAAALALARAKARAAQRGDR